MKFSKSFEISASVCEIDKLIDLVKFIFDIHKRDRDCTSAPEVVIEKRNGSKVSFKTIDEFEDDLRRSLTSIRGINFLYWGSHQRIEIRVNEWSKNIKIYIASEKEEDLLKSENFIKDVFSEKSWNSYSFTLFILSYFILTVSMLVFFAIKQKVAVGIITLLLYMIFLPAYWIADSLSALYPALVIIYKDKKSGRSLKNDLLFFILTLAIPFLLSKI